MGKRFLPPGAAVALVVVGGVVLWGALAAGAAPEGGLPDPCTPQACRSSHEPHRPGTMATVGDCGKDMTAPCTYVRRGADGENHLYYVDEDLGSATGVRVVDLGVW